MGIGALRPQACVDAFCSGVQGLAIRTPSGVYSKKNKETRVPRMLSFFVCRKDAYADKAPGRGLGSVQASRAGARFQVLARFIKWKLASCCRNEILMFSLDI